MGDASKGLPSATGEVQVVSLVMIGGGKDPRDLARATPIQKMEELSYRGSFG